jgi:predicted ribosome quality control (RQC) complex YloA/Tae2 family protein
MTHHVAHTNKMMFDLKEQYQAQISRLQNKISEQEQEIAKLKTLISLLTIEREYDC